MILIRTWRLMKPSCKPNVILDKQAKRTWIISLLTEQVAGQFKKLISKRIFENCKIGGELCNYNES